MAEHSVTVENTLSTLLSDKKYTTIRDILVTMNPADIAAVFSGVPTEKLPLLFRLLPKELAAESFVEMESDQQEALIRGISDSELRQVLDELYVDDAVDIVEEMPANVVQRILAQSDPEMRKEINEILQYPENSAGSVMTTEYVKLSPNMTVGDAILRIRRTGVDKETIYTCYVLENRLLVGTVSVKSLLLAPSDLQTIDSIMESNLITVTTHTDQEEVAQMMSKYNLLAIPVVDGDNRMVGIVTFDDAMDVMEDEATEDIEIMAGMTPSDKTYLRSSPLDLFLHRIPWLSLLLISATFTGLILTNFEEKLAVMVCLTAFIPMLMDTGGNSGSQSSVTVIRALSLGVIPAMISMSSVASSSITSMASSKVTIPTIRLSPSTTGIASRLYLLIIRATSSWSVCVVTVIRFDSMMLSMVCRSLGASSRLFTETVPTRIRFSST